jgi:hypothetical protein
MLSTIADKISSASAGALASGGCSVASMQQTGACHEQDAEDLDLIRPTY